MNSYLKKLISTTLAASCCIAMATGCGSSQSSSASSTSQSTASSAAPASSFNEKGLPIVNEPITLRVVAKKRSDVPDFETMTFFKNVEEATGINIEWELVSQDTWNEKKSLMFTSPDSLPDVFYGNDVLTDNEVVKYGSQGLLLPLNDLWDKYSDNLTTLEATGAPNLKQISTSPDGNIYALPGVHGGQSTSSCALYVNTEWLKKVNMDPPKTTDDFEKMLIAFKNAKDLNGNGTNDELPFTFKFKGIDGVNGVGAMFGAFGRIDNTEHMVVENDTVIFTAVEDEYKEAVKWFNKLFAQGLIDKESFTQDSSVIFSKIKNDPLIVGSAPFWNKTWATGDAESPLWTVIPPLVGPDGHQLWAEGDISINSFGAFAITKNCKNPEVAFRLGDYFYNEDVARDSFFGPLGVTVEKDAAGKYVPLPTPEGSTEQEFRLPHAPIFNGIYAIPASKFENEYKDLAISMVEKNITLNKNLYAQYCTANYFPKMYFTPEEVEVISTLKTDLISYVDEKTAEWMLNGGIDDEWDTFKQELEKIGLSKYLKLHQDAYNRYSGK